MRETPPARTTVYRSHFLREMAPPGRGCVVWTVGLVSAPSYPRRLSRPHHQSHTAHDTVELLARGHRRSSCTCNIKNNSTPPRHPVSSPVASRVSALLPPVGGDAVKPSSVPDDVGAKCSGPSFRNPNLRLNCADLRVTPRTGLAGSHELVGGLELSGLFADPVTDREPIVHCRFEVQI